MGPTTRDRRWSQGSGLCHYRHSSYQSRGVPTRPAFANEIPKVTDRHLNETEIWALNSRFVRVRSKATLSAPVAGERKPQRRSALGSEFRQFCRPALNHVSGIPQQWITDGEGLSLKTVHRDVLNLKILLGMASRPRRRLENIHRGTASLVLTQSTPNGPPCTRDMGEHLSSGPWSWGTLHGDEDRDSTAGRTAHGRQRFGTQVAGDGQGGRPSERCRHPSGTPSQIRPQRARGMAAARGRRTARGLASDPLVTWKPLWPLIEGEVRTRQPEGFRWPRANSKGWIGPVHSPLRVDRHPSFSVRPDTGGEPGGWKGHATGDGGGLLELARQLGTLPPGKWSEFGEEW